MKPLARSWSYGVTVFGLILGLWGWRDLERLSLPAKPEALANLDYPIRLPGARVGSPAQLRFWIQSEPPGRAVTVLPTAPSGSAREIRLVPQLGRVQRAVTLLTGLFFLAVNLLVFCPRAGPRETRDFYWATLFYGTAILIGGAYRPSGALWPAILPSLVWITCLTLLPFLFVHLTLTFPRRRPWLDQARRIRPLYWSAAVGLAVAQMAALIAHVCRPDPATWDVYARTLLLAEGAMVLLVGYGVITLFRGAARLELSRERRQVRWLQWGFAVGVAPYVFLRTLPRLAGIESPVDPAVDRLFELAIPVAFTGAVAWERFLDIDLVIRRSLIYSILAALLAGVYFALAFLLGRMLHPAWPHAETVAPALAAVAAMSLFHPTRQALGRWVDGAIFQLQRDLERELRRFEAEIVEATSPEGLAQRLHDFLTRVLLPKQALILVQGEAETVAFGDVDLRPASGAETHDASDLVASWAAACDLRREASSGEPGLLLAAPQSTSLPERECPAFPEECRRRGVRLIGALARGSQPIGWVLLGEKQSERRYVEEDLRLLAGALGAAAETMERIELVRHVAEEALARRQLDELNRLKNDFLARASHDLRTPLTSIGWSVRNLLDGVAGPIEGRPREYLEGIRVSADQLSRLVTNLVEISRLESGAVRFEPHPTSLGAALHEAALAARPLAEARGVRIETSIDPALPAIPGEHGKLVQIALNLLDNAVRYSPAAGVVEARVQPAGGGRQALTVRDRGPGVAPDERETIFERYRQGRPTTDPPGLSAGLGVGLYVVRVLTRLHGGEVSVSDPPGGGGLFTCLFPGSERKEG